MNDIAIEKIDKFVDMYRSGSAAKEIGKSYELSGEIVRIMLSAFKKIGVISCEDETERKLRIKEQKSKKIKERNNNIIIDYENSLSVDEIKKKYCISYQTIKNVLVKEEIYLGRHWYRNLKYPKNIIFDIFGEINFEVSEDTKKGLDFCIVDMMSEREKKILSEYYENELTFKDIGKKFSLSSNRIKQIKDRAIRKLQNPSKSNYIKFGYDGYTEMIKKKKQELQDEIKKKEKKLQDKLDKKEFGNIKIKELELSTKSYNCLTRAGIRVISDIKSKEQLMKIRNLGGKTCDEIIQKIINIGYEIPEDES